MSKYVLVSDTTLSHEYSNFPLLDFLPCAPSRAVPGPVYRFLKGAPPPSLEGGAARNAPYALRKLESALLAQNPSDGVIVAHENHVQDCIDEDTAVIGVYTMDPLGLGPLSLSYSVLFNDSSKPWVRIEFERLIARLNFARKGTKAKLVVGGPGVWELSVMPEVMEELGIDLAFQGEADDIINEIFDSVARGDVEGDGYFGGFQSFDASFHKRWVANERFISRGKGKRQFPALEDIPLIRAPSIKGLVEIMRGCGIGCDFCEVTLRPLRYYSEEMVAKEVSVNAMGGCENAWLHTDEIFGFEHGPHFVPNEEAITGIFRAAMGVKGIKHANPTHGRISVPAGYPELVKKISTITRAGPAHWVGVQVGLETGSERLALVHMPNKTLPLRIGADGSWQQIVMEGLQSLNRAYWRPAFTVQVGQMDETPDDNWETVALVNRMSAMTVDGRPSEFTVTPMQNVPLGLIKSRGFSSQALDTSQLAVYYVCYRHLAKMALRDSARDSSGGILKRAAVASVLNLGSLGLLHRIESICRKRGLDLEKASRFGLPASGVVTPLITR